MAKEQIKHTSLPCGYRPFWDRVTVAEQEAIIRKINHKRQKKLV